MQILNDPRPWWGTLRGRPMDVADLVAAATLTTRTAATLWWVIEHGASVFAAAGPPGAGKSTLANALLEFLPQDACVYVTRGAWDRMEVPQAPGPIYLLINELSAHMPLYLSGPAARRALELTRRGVRIVGTLHARNAAEAVRVMCYEADLPRGELVAPFVFVVLEAGWSGPRIQRRVVEVGFLPPSGSGELVSWGLPTSDQVQTVGIEALANWTNLSSTQVRAEIDERAVLLEPTTPVGPQR